MAPAFRQWPQFFVQIFMIGVGFAVGEFIMGRIFDRYAPAALEFAKAHLGEMLFQFSFVAVVLIVAVGLFTLRYFQRRLYGSIEIIFGFFAAVYAANELYVAATPYSQTKGAVASLAGIYIIIRGMDNWQQGARKA
jgi:hypothetical protein